MTTQNRHITRIEDTWDNFWINGDHGQSAICTDAAYPSKDAWAYKSSDANRQYAVARQYYYDGITTTYVDNEFGSVNVYGLLLCQRGTGDQQFEIAYDGSNYVKFYVDGSANMYISANDDNTIEISANGTTTITNSLTIGEGTAATDYTLTFDGETNDGVLTWMEDEDYFKYSDDILLDTTERIYLRDTAISIHSAADGKLDIEADSEVHVNLDGNQKLAIVGGGLQIGSGEVGSDYAMSFIGASNTGSFAWRDDENEFEFYDDLIMNTDIRIYFRDSAISIASAADGKLDIEADSEIHININGSEEVNISANAVTIGAGAAADYDITFDCEDADGVFSWSGLTDAFRFWDDVRIESTEKLFFRDSAIYIYSESDAQIKIVSDGNIELNSPYVRGSGHKSNDIGQANPAFDDVYADDFNNVADIPFLDCKDDLATINGIKSSGITDERTGLPVIDDMSLPEWLLVRDKIGKKVLYDPDGKPYFSVRTMIGLLMGAIRQLDKKIETKFI